MSLNAPDLRPPMNTPAILRQNGLARIVFVQDVSPGFAWFVHVRRALGPLDRPPPARYFAPKDRFEYGSAAIAAHVAFALGVEAESWPDDRSD